MALTQAQRSMMEKARSAGGGAQGVALTDDAATGLLAVIAADLDLTDRFPEFPADLPGFFDWLPIADPRLPSGRFVEFFEKMLNLEPDTDTYFACLAALYKSRAKYAYILETQPIPTIDQVGPRGLLQFGKLSPKGLTGFLFWRKWMFDIDNRAGQETGYLFEPIIANAIGGAPISAKRSPVRSQHDRSKGRQIDCIRGTRAYEIKIRVTIAASGQGRWQAELDFPGDCRASGYEPVLVVLDPTDNAKLSQLRGVFKAQSGDVYIGEQAWRHLESEAGPTMARFLEKYVRTPIQVLLENAPDHLPDLTLRMDGRNFVASMNGESFSVQRAESIDDAEVEDVTDPIPEDAADQLPGP